MKKRMIIFAAVAAATALSPICAKAGEPIKAEIGTDIVSSYLWRGSKLDGASIQPAVGLEWKGLSLGAWGSTSFCFDACEVDLTLSYSIGGFTVGITDYWCADSGSKYFDFSSETLHVAEVNLGYDFGPVALNWYTNCLGAVGCGPEGGKAYSSYFEISAPFCLGGLEWSAALGATPWANDYYGADGFAIVCASLTASKEISLGADFSIPVFASLMANPRSEQLFFSVGISF
ncbi:MAG: hypothetical protein ACI399_05405 [Candidatus Cryptobacteroides sp.]